jgi:hypothetical protein
MSLFFITFGMELQLPNLPIPDLHCKFYGESTSDDIIFKLIAAHGIARCNTEDTSDDA